MSVKEFGERMAVLETKVSTIWTLMWVLIAQVSIMMVVSFIKMMSKNLIAGG